MELKLYELPGKVDAIFDRYVDLDTGEVMDEERFDLEIGELELEADKLYEYIGIQIKNEQTTLEAFDEEIKRLQTRKKFVQNAIEGKKRYLQSFFRRDKLETPRVKISWLKSSRVEISPLLDASEIFIDHELGEQIVKRKISFEFSKTEIKKLLDQGALESSDDGFKLVESNNIQIK